MKKIYYLVSLALLTIFTACDYNATNFPGFDQAANPTNIATYTYTLVSTDYTTISKAALAIAKTKADSTIATAIGTNKYFLTSTTASSSIPLLLSTKYLYVDENSAAVINCNLSIDTTTIASTNKYTLVNPTDYLSMGNATGQPGKGNFFSSTIDPNFYIPIYLKKTYAYALKGDIKLIRYNYGNATTQIATVYVYDGTNWGNYNTNNQLTKSFVYRGGKWLDLLIFKEGFTKDIGTFTQQQVVGTYLWYWGNYNGGCMQANAYNKGACESWLVSPAIDLTNRTNPKLAFDHAVNYGTGLAVTDLTGAYVSTDYTNDVTKATWTKLSFTYPTTYSFTFLNSGKIDLTAYSNKKITLAFKYVSTGTALAWEISNINLTDEK